MMKFQDQIIFGIFTFFMIINFAHSLKCYTCSTDAGNGEFCKDPFKKDKLTQEQRKWSESDCKDMTMHTIDSVNLKTVCKKVVEEVNNIEVIQRQCYIQNVHDPKDLCAHTEISGNRKIKFCETCDKDFCNSSGLFVPAFTLVLLPALITRIFTL